MSSSPAKHNLNARNRGAPSAKRPFAGDGNGRAPETGAGDGSSPGRCVCRWRSGAAASRRIKSKATGRPRAAVSARCACGGAPTAARARARACRCAGSARRTPGAKTRPTAATTGRIRLVRGSGRRPAVAAAITSTISSSRSTTTRGRASPAAAAPCSSTSRARISGRPRAASRCGRRPPQRCSSGSSRKITNHDSLSPLATLGNAAALAENRRADAAHASPRIAIASRKSALMPIDNKAQPVAARDLGHEGEMRRGRLVERRNAHQALDRQPVGRRDRRARTRRHPRGSTPAFCGSAPVLTSTNRRGAGPAARFPWRAPRRASAGRPYGSRRTAPPPRAPCWTAADRSDAARCRDARP